MLSKIPPFDPEEGALRVVVETPRGSRNKYKFNSSCNCMELSHVLPEGMSFPFDFGFVPSTCAEDGDPLDTLILADAPLTSGCLLTVRLLGAITARQKEEGRDWVRNDRLVAVASDARGVAAVRSLADLPENMMRDLKAFFVQYNNLRGRYFEPLEEGGPSKASDLVEAAIAQFQHRQRRHS